MKFIADLHVHSKYSRATARNLDLENLYIYSQLKGITVVGTGDFTHPAWFSEIKEKLIPAEEGLFKLRDDIARRCDEEVPSSCKRDVQFILSCEISNIYKKNDKTRKNHNVVFVPDLEIAEQFNNRLDQIGNIKSDGRPILGLDAKNLLEILLETSDKSFLIPAHIWTPWFSLLGSKSGFDSLEECFEDLSSHIFAVETGLSSDPLMNWRVSSLDRLTLVSNSDAHSPSKLGREANIFNTDLSYPAMVDALKTGDTEKFLGTYEFYPEEGKYHYDGHRKCNIQFTPEESIAHDNICPICNKSLTLGVLYRVDELSDRNEGEKPEIYHPYDNIIPLDEILSELLKVGPKTKKVLSNLNHLFKILGSEFDILKNIPLNDLKNTGIPNFSKAIKRLRENKIRITPGFDGEFGKIKIFSEKELEKISGQKSLFVIPESKKKNDIKIKKKVNLFKKKYDKDSLFSGNKKENFKTTATGNKNIFLGLNNEQKEAVQQKDGPLLIIAGPGTGKTHTITRKIAYLINEKNISVKNILALTFTNKAAQEMKDRIRKNSFHLESFPYIATFHSLCFKFLNDNSLIVNNTNFNIIDEFDRKIIINDAVNIVKKQTNISLTLQDYLYLIILAKQNILSPSDCLDSILDKINVKADELIDVYKTYQLLLKSQNIYDFEDLIFNMVKLLENDESFRLKYKKRFTNIFVDEYQDLNHGQYRIIKSLTDSDSDICVIGDPDQSIYGFRGSDSGYFNTFKNDFPDAKVINLSQNYRSTGTILHASCQVINEQEDKTSRSTVFSEIEGVKTIEILEFDTEKAEAVSIGKIIEQMIGGLGFHSIDFNKIDSHKSSSNENQKDKSFSDFAILYRTGSQGKIFADIFEKAGIPYQMVSKENIYLKKGISTLISYLKIINNSGSYIDFEKIINFNNSDINRKGYNLFKSWMFVNNFSLNEAFKNLPKFSTKELTKITKDKFNQFVINLFKIKNKIKHKLLEEQIEYTIKNNKDIEKAINEQKSIKNSLITLVNHSKQYRNNISGFFESLSLNADTDIYDYHAEKVSLMTIHAAKGLEFPVVFITGCEDDYIPYRKPVSKNKLILKNFNINEERRLFYVAMTRAKENLYMTYTKNRMIYGKKTNRFISPFVRDIEKVLRKHEELSKNYKIKKPDKEKPVQLELF